MIHDASQRVVPIWEQVEQTLEKRRQTIERQEQRIINEGDTRDTNAWLERAGWHCYLNGLDREKLLESIETPDEETEPVLATVWHAMDEMIHHCQETVLHRVGLFVRMEVIRTEQHQTRYHPLQAYMDERAIREYSRPWKQIIMFIGRTRQQQEWDIPKYRMRSKQRKAWKYLIRVAREETQQRRQQDDNDDNDDAAVQSIAESVDPDQAAEYMLKPLPKACLEFCISLLDERITQKEYHSILVCALAVLGVKADGWLGPDRYPPI